ncbi:hypothetical protein [Streptomyces nitrosporeus]|uniref:Uncharacterized protein n=1 Tax=Streptomyces nitrosporeus TaxID=28894 RepID=A0A5J6F8G9_9ACTN|nr:hypothetical protein [Streptomyces nitrosporeus]QEU72648.1 hypothetical protein CP967_12170 [Streptomyces nitrosporeus]
MTTSQTTSFVRLRVDLVLEITDAGALTGAALENLAAGRTEAGRGPADSDGPDTHGEEAVREDAAEALASLVDPLDLVGRVPGVELAQASWNSEPVDYDPDAEDWTVGDDEDDAYFGIEDNETDNEEAIDAEYR